MAEGGIQGAAKGGTCDRDRPWWYIQQGPAWVLLALNFYLSRIQ